MKREIGKILGKKDNKLIDNCMRKRSIDIKVKLLRLRIFSHLFLQFHSNCLWNCDNCNPNPLKLSFPTYSLQIYYLWLIGLLHYKFGPQIETSQLQTNYIFSHIVWVTSILNTQSILEIHPQRIDPLPTCCQRSFQSRLGTCPVKLVNGHKPFPLKHL